MRAVERRADGSYAVVLHRLGSPAALDRGCPAGRGGGACCASPRRRVAGYQQRSSHVRPRDLRARRKSNARAFAWWLLGRLGHDVPVVERALFAGDLGAIEELREALAAAAPPEPEPVFAIGSNGGQAAA